MGGLECYRQFKIVWRMVDKTLNVPMPFGCKMWRMVSKAINGLRVAPLEVGFRV